MSQSHPSIHRNNEAISHMERRDFLSAITLMTESMWILKQDGSDNDLLPLAPSVPQQAASQESVDRQKKDSCEDKEEMKKTTSQDSPNPPRNGDRNSEPRQECVSDSGISIFQSPLRIDAGTRIDEDTCTEICAILTYNCALAYHLNGMELTQVEGCNDSLKHALSLYQKAHAIHLKLMEEVEDSDVSFTLAILNNVGQLHSLVGNTVASARCFHRMLRILMVVVSQADETCTAETDLFFGNCSRFILEKPAAPAA